MKTAEALYRALLTGNFRSLRRAHFQYWDNVWLSHHPHIGYELEFNCEKSLYPLAEVSLKYAVNLRRTHSYELQFLTQTNSPISWRASIMEVLQVLKERDLPTTGSIHCNVETTHKIWKLLRSLDNSWNFGRRSSDCAKEGQYRLENKYFCGVINPKDLILQTILWVEFIRLRRNKTQIRKAVERISLLLDVLTADWSEQEKFTAVNYPEIVSEWFEMYQLCLKPQIAGVVELVDTTR